MKATYTKNGVTYYIESSKLVHYTPDDLVEMMWLSQKDRTFWGLIAARLSKEEKAKILAEATAKVREERESHEKSGSDLYINDSLLK